MSPYYMNERSLQKNRTIHKIGILKNILEENWGKKKAMNLFSGQLQWCIHDITRMKLHSKET